MKENKKNKKKDNITVKKDIQEISNLKGKKEWKDLKDHAGTPGYIGYSKKTSKP